MYALLLLSSAMVIADQPVCSSEVDIPTIKRNSNAMALFTGTLLGITAGKTITAVAQCTQPYYESLNSITARLAFNIAAFIVSIPMGYGIGALANYTEKVLLTRLCSHPALSETDLQESRDTMRAATLFNTGLWTAYLSCNWALNYTPAPQPVG